MQSFQYDGLIVSDSIVYASFAETFWYVIHSRMTLAYLVVAPYTYAFMSFRYFSIQSLFADVNVCFLWLHGFLMYEQYTHKNGIFFVQSIRMREDTRLGAKEDNWREVWKEGEGEAERELREIPSEVQLAFSNYHQYVFVYPIGCVIRVLIILLMKEEKNVVHETNGILFFLLVWHVFRLKCQHTNFMFEHSWCCTFLSFWHLLQIGPIEHTTKTIYRKWRPNEVWLNERKSTHRLHVQHKRSSILVKNFESDNNKKRTIKKHTHTTEKSPKNTWITLTYKKRWTTDKRQ